MVTSGWPPPVLERLDDLKEQPPDGKMGISRYRFLSQASKFRPSCCSSGGALSFVSVRSIATMISAEASALSPSRAQAYQAVRTLVAVYAFSIKGLLTHHAFKMEQRDVASHETYAQAAPSPQIRRQTVSCNPKSFRQ